jgi:uncharacterized membrane protein
MVDVTTEIVIDAPLERVAGFTADPANAPRWYTNIRSAEWRSEPVVREGSTIDFVARFVGRELRYTYEIVELAPFERLVMRTAQGPFPMETTYTWTERDGKTLMSLRNRGEPSGFGRIAAPFMASAVRRATRKDLARLKSIMEDEPS